MMELFYTALTKNNSVVAFFTLCITLSNIWYLFYGDVEPMMLVQALHKLGNISKMSLKPDQQFNFEG